MTIVEKWASAAQPPPPPEVETEADSNSEPLPLPVPPDRPVVSILALHRDSKDQKGGKKRVTFADEAASSDSDLSDSLKVSSTNEETGKEVKVTESDPSDPSSSGLTEKGEEDSCVKEDSDGGAEANKQEADCETMAVAEITDVSAEKSDSGETEVSKAVDNVGGLATEEANDVNETASDQSETAKKECETVEEKSEAVPTEVRTEGPMTRHRASRRPSVLPSTRGKRRGGRRRNSAEDKEATDMEKKKEDGDDKDGGDKGNEGVRKEEDGEKKDADDSSSLKVVMDSVDQRVSEDTTDTSQDSETAMDTAPAVSDHPHAALGFSQLLKDAVGGDTRTPYEQAETADSFAKPLELSEESASLSSESDSTDSDMASSLSAPSVSHAALQGEGEAMLSVAHEATFAEVYCDTEEMDDITSKAAQLLSGWSELKVNRLSPFQNYEKFCM